MKSTTGIPTSTRPLNILLFGNQTRNILPEFQKYPALNLVDEQPDIVVCYGGDGTLLAAELEWPGIPKVPVLNSQRGHKCIPHAPAEVIARLADGDLISNTYMKLHCTVRHAGDTVPASHLSPLNEINVQKGRVNNAVRFRLWIDGHPYCQGHEILGDGFVICTPFGSTAYFSKITRGVFTQGIGIAFNATGQQTNHIIVSEENIARVLITRGPAIMAHDSSPKYINLKAGDELTVKRHSQGATILTCSPIKRLDEPF
jgi:NAD+ kinase